MCPHGALTGKFLGKLLNTCAGAARSRHRQVISNDLASEGRGSVDHVGATAMRSVHAGFRSAGKESDPERRVTQLNTEAPAPTDGRADMPTDRVDGVSTPNRTTGEGSATLLHRDNTVNPMGVDAVYARVLELRAEAEQAYDADDTVWLEALRADARRLS
jgi:hypothetical protein